jgi:hypothetical protein
LDKEHFDQLTDAASRLMASGLTSIYSDRREALLPDSTSTAAAGQHAFPPEQRGGASASNGGGSPGAESDYVLDEQTGCYFHRTTGWCFDPRSQLHWDPQVQPPSYFYYDAATGAYVPWQAVAAPAAAAAPGAAP